MHINVDFCIHCAEYSLEYFKNSWPLVGGVIRLVNSDKNLWPWHFFELFPSLFSHPPPLFFLLVTIIWIWNLLLLFLVFLFFLLSCLWNEHIFSFFSFIEALLANRLIRYLKCTMWSSDIHCERILKIELAIHHLTYLLFSFCENI